MKENENKQDLSPRSNRFRKAALIACILMTFAVPVTTAIYSAVAEASMEPASRLQLQANRECNSLSIAFDQTCATRRAEARETLARMTVTPQPSK